jgi:hypothetical protein
LKKFGGLLLVDDTPLDFNSWHKAQGSSLPQFFYSFIEDYGFVPGKGGLVKKYLESEQIGTLLWHDYQILYRF